MLSRSMLHPRVEYAHYDRKHLDFEKEYFDIVTFAGSLHYAKSAQMLDEVIKVSKNGAKIVIYDFELLLDDILGMLGAEGNTGQKPEYDHQVDLSGLDRKNIETEQMEKTSVTVEICTPDLTHLILSSKDNYRLLLKLFGPKNIYIKVFHKLNSVLTGDMAKIKANTYTTIYNVMK